MTLSRVLRRRRPTHFGVEHRQEHSRPAYLPPVWFDCQMQVTSFSNRTTRMCYLKCTHSSSACPSASPALPVPQQPKRWPQGDLVTEVRPESTLIGKLEMTS